MKALAFCAERLGASMGASWAGAAELRAEDSSTAEAR